MWVADMDFRSPPAVIAALHERADHGVFGYTAVPRDLVSEVQFQLKVKYDWVIEEEWLVWLPGLVTGLNVVCRAVGRDAPPGFDHCSRLYFPFSKPLDIPDAH